MPANFTFPQKLEFLLTTKARYKVAYGGRGGAKSHSFAKALIILAMDRPLRVLCAREYQNSMADSVYKLLCDIIRENDLESFFTILHDSIRCANGGEFRFMGILTNPQKVKSFEGIDICWIAEAAKMSKESMEILRPTIRKAGSEIWMEFNPDSADDYIYKTFVLAKIKPPRTIIQEINYWDNKWFPAELQEEMEHDRATDMDNYLHIWCGKPKRVLTGAVYADEIRQALLENRVTVVPYNPDVPVQVFWDLGWSDYMALWFVQKVGMNYHIIDYYQNRLKTLTHYFQIMQGKGYVYGLMWQPHDATHGTIGSFGKSVEDLTRKAGYKVRIVPKLKITNGINAAREIFPRCYFDEAATKEGFDALCKYHWNDKAKAKGTPEHDAASHGSDGFRYFGVCIERGMQIIGGMDIDEEGNDVKLDVLRSKIPYNLGTNPGDGWMR